MGSDSAFGHRRHRPDLAQPGLRPQHAGGALAIRTKSGFSHPGGKLELSGGSFGRSNTELEYGGNNGTLGWYVAGDWFREDGWRDYSPSDVKQFFGKLSFRNSAGEADLTLTQARTRLIGNGLVPQAMNDERRAAIFACPDETQRPDPARPQRQAVVGRTQSLSGARRPQDAHPDAERRHERQLRGRLGERSEHAERRPQPHTHRLVRAPVRLCSGT